MREGNDNNVSHIKIFYFLPLAILDEQRLRRSKRRRRVLMWEETPTMGYATIIVRLATIMDVT
jgi:hypothetical protein